MTTQLLEKQVVRVLIIEDNQADRIILQRYLERCQKKGFETEHAADLHQALEILEDNHFDLVFLDNYLADGTTAKDVLDDFHEKNIDIPVIIITGSDDPQLVVDLMKSGVYDYISKNNLTPEFIEKAVLNTLRQHTLEIEHKQLEEENRNLAKFPSEDPNPVLRISSDCKILYANNAGSPVLKAWKCEQGRHLQPAQCKLVEEVLKLGKPAVFNLDCDDRIFSITMAPVSRPGYVNVYGLDITELMLSKEHLKEAQNRSAMKSQFVSVISHELRTPLTSMKGSIAILSNGAIGAINKKQREMLDITKGNIDRLTRLINEVLDFQKLDAGKTGFNMQRNDINEIVGEVEKTTLPLVGKAGLKLIVKLDETLPMVNLDRDKIIQVLTNLVDNAVKFTEKGGITITTAKNDNIICVSVQDTGCGIKKEDMSKLFNQFEQLSGVNDRKTGGTGLGLAICKEIIEKHNGKITAESEFGEGTTISFVLPIKDRRNRSRREVREDTDKSDITEPAQSG